MKILTFHIPDSVDLDNMQIAMLVASRLYEQDKLSLGQAAELELKRPHDVGTGKSQRLRLYSFKN